MMKKTLVICFLLALSVFTCKKDKVVISNPAYAIGVVSWYKPANNRGSSRIDFLYNIRGTVYENNYANNDNGWSVPANGGYNTGNQYMVQYDKSNPTDSYRARFLFDYPVSDSTDYKNYLTQFNAHPPSCCLVYACRGLLKFSY